MPIQPTSGSVIIPPIEQKTADKYWLKNLVINAPSLTDKAEAIATLVPYNSTTGEMFPKNSVRLVIDDVLTKAATDQQLGATCEALFLEIDRQAKLKHLI